MRIRPFFCFVVLIVGSLANAQTPGPCGRPTPKPLVDWPQFRFDLCNTGFNPNETLLSPASVGNLALDWKFTTGASIYDAPLVANGNVYLGAWDNYVYALNANTGQMIWKYYVGNGTGVQYTPAVANGTVFVGDSFGTIFALKATTGALLWKYQIDAFGINAAVTVANGLVYVGNGFAADNSLYALNANTGALVWKFKVGGMSGFVSSPAVVNNTLYVGAIDGTFYALNATTSAILWTYQPADSSSRRRRWSTESCTSAPPTAICMP